MHKLNHYELSFNHGFNICMENRLEWRDLLLESPNVTLKQRFLLGFSQILPRGTIKFASARSLRPSGHAAGIYQGLARSQEIQTSQREEGESCHNHPVRYVAWFWPVLPLGISLSAGGHSPRASPFPFSFLPPSPLTSASIFPGPTWVKPHTRCWGCNQRYSSMVPDLKERQTYKPLEHLGGVVSQRQCELTRDVQLYHSTRVASWNDRWYTLRVIPRLYCHND